MHDYWMLIGACNPTVCPMRALRPYLEQNPFFGCLVGRHSGRLQSPFTIDGVEYSVAGSDGGGGGIDESTNLHGGKVGWDKKNWEVRSPHPPVMWDYRWLNFLLV